MKTIRDLKHLTPLELSILSQISYFEKTNVFKRVGNCIKLENIQNLSKTLAISRVWYYNIVDRLIKKEYLTLEKEGIMLNLSKRCKYHLYVKYKNS